MRIKLAPIIKLIPQAMAKNGTAAEMSRMMVGGVEAQYRMSWTLAAFRNNTLASSQKERRPYERLSCFAYDDLNFKQMK